MISEGKEPRSPAGASRMRIPLHRPSFDEAEWRAARRAIEEEELEAGGRWTRRCEELLAAFLRAPQVLATSSCTHALEMSLMLAGVGPGDEVLVPAFNFPSDATCVLRQGAQPVFVAVREQDLNIDPADAAQLIGPRTRAIIAMHYGGSPCDMSALSQLAEQHQLALVEDAALALGSSYQGRPCGSLADFGCLSFNSKKNVTCGEAGALFVRAPEALARARLLREMGTDRDAFRKGELERYTWRDEGSSFVPSEILMAVLSAQLEKLAHLTRARRGLFERYASGLADFAHASGVRLPSVRAGDEVNGGQFWLLYPSEAGRRHAEQGLRAHGIEAAAHYDDLSHTPAGRRFRRSPRLEEAGARSLPARVLRLPLHSGLATSEQDEVIERTIQLGCAP